MSLDEILEDVRGAVYKSMPAHLKPEEYLTKEERLQPSLFGDEYHEDYNTLNDDYIVEACVQLSKTKNRLLYHRYRLQNFRRPDLGELDPDEEDYLEQKVAQYTSKALEEARAEGKFPDPRDVLTNAPDRREYMNGKLNGRYGWPGIGINLQKLAKCKGKKREVYMLIEDVYDILGEVEGYEQAKSDSLQFLSHYAQNRDDIRAALRGEIPWMDAVRRMSDHTTDNQY